MKRIDQLTRHLTNANANTSSNAANYDKKGQQYEAELGSIKVEMDQLDYNIADHLAGPYHDHERFPNGWKDVFFHFRKYLIKGISHACILDYQKQYGGAQGEFANIVIPVVIHRREGSDNSGPRAQPVISQEVIIGNPDDAQRIAKMHALKSPIFTTLFYNSVISTTDMDHWQDQREHIVKAFLPQASLSKIFPVTLARAEICPERLQQLVSESNDGLVDMDDFLLYETQAQLHLALFGTSQEFMDKTNKDFRESLAGNLEPQYARDYCKHLFNEMKTTETSFPETAASKCPVKGPLSHQLTSLDISGRNQLGNTFIFAFAGHDTTGHTLAWLLFELARHPEAQKKLQAEIDEFFADLKGRDMTYDDLPRLKYMTKCVMESLRLWPAVPNGTFREIMFDDTITGPNGESVIIKKGTYVRIPNWSRHRSVALWGPDANVFNPDREWKENELWNGEGFRAYNPQSSRFSPFTFEPRDCIGKNFAQMEMRAILCHLLSKYSFALSPELESIDETTFEGINYATMGPPDLSKPKMLKAFAGYGPGMRAPVGLRLRPVPR